MNGGHRHRTPLHLIALALYRLADHKHEVISSAPEADGIALLYSNSPGRGGGAVGVPPLYHFFLLILLSIHFCRLQTPQKPLAQQSLCIPHLIQSPFIPWLASLQSISTLSVSISPPRVRSTFKDRESRDQNWIDTSASFCHALYNETYITRLHTTGTVCHSRCL